MQCLTQQDAARLAGEDGDYHTRDLFEAIAKKEFPSWILHMQIMPFDEAQTYRFNPPRLRRCRPDHTFLFVDAAAWVAAKVGAKSS